MSYDMECICCLFNNTDVRVNTTGSENTEPEAGSEDG
jgi:hypothetical protein